MPSWGKLQATLAERLRYPCSILLFQNSSHLWPGNFLTLQDAALNERGGIDFVPFCEGLRIFGHPIELVTPVCPARPAPRGGKADGKPLPQKRYRCEVAHNLFSFRYSLPGSHAPSGVSCSPSLRAQFAS